MDKPKLLQELAQGLQNGEISREELLGLLRAMEPPARQTRPVTKSSPFTATRLLYALGALTVIIGLCIFVAQIWADLGTAGRIAVSLGLGLLLAACGSMLLKQKPGNQIGAVFHLIGGALMPFGALVTLHELGGEPSSLWPVAGSFGALLLFYVLLNTAHRHPVLSFFTIANGTACVYLLLGALLEDAPWPYAQFPEDAFAWLSMLMGAVYLLLAHAFRDGWNRGLLGLLYFFGSAGLLAAAFSQVFHSPAWQLVYFLLVLGMLLLSVYLKSSIVLAVSMLFLTVHVAYITSEYFAHSLGWPMALVLLGFLFVALGYASVAINRKYIRSAA